MRYVILGTAGHIDHGKSALVMALTGIDPDRLKEEKERGITIDLGFSYLNYPDGTNVGIVDVPGHERLVKNMLAGAGGIDLVLMVIAADEGVMPQSREHLAICDLLKIKKGLIAVTKSDLVDDEWLELVKNDIQGLVEGTFLQGSDIIPVSSKTGHNLDKLKQKINGLAADIKAKPVKGIFRLPVDRVFTLKGFGTVVSGTAVSGSISVNDAVQILPRGAKTRIRGLHSHGKSLEKAYAGQRVAMNLQGIEKEDLRRGDVVSLPDRIRPTSMIDARIELLRDIPLSNLKNRSLVHFHTGTAELTGRIIIYDMEELKSGESAYCQLRFREMIAAMSGDRFVIRRFSPLLTIGGGEILDTSPRRRRRKEGYDDLKVFEKGGLKDRLLMKIFHAGIAGTTPQDLEGWINSELPVISDSIKQLVEKGDVIKLENRLLHKKAFGDFKEKVLSTIRAFHQKNPLRPGISKEDLRAVFRRLDQRLFEGLLANIKGLSVDREVVRLKTFRISLGRDKELSKEKILKNLEKASFNPPSKDELAKSISASSKELGELLGLMAAEGSVVRINDAIYISSANHKKMINGLKGFFRKKSEMTVGEFRDILGTSRKYAVPFLEYLDSNRITLRVKDVRKLLIKPD